MKRKVHALHFKTIKFLAQRSKMDKMQLSRFETSHIYISAGAFKYLPLLFHPSSPPSSHVHRERRAFSMVNEIVVLQKTLSRDTMEQWGKTFSTRPDRYDAFPSWRDTFFIGVIASKILRAPLLTRRGPRLGGKTPLARNSTDAPLVHRPPIRTAVHKTDGIPRQDPPSTSIGGNKCACASKDDD